MRGWHDNRRSVRTVFVRLAGVRASPVTALSIPPTTTRCGSAPHIAHGAHTASTVLSVLTFPHFLAVSCHTHSARALTSVCTPRRAWQRRIAAARTPGMAATWQQRASAFKPDKTTQSLIWDGQDWTWDRDQ